MAIRNPWHGCIKIIDQNQNRNLNKKIQLDAPGQNLLSVLQENQVYLDAPCAGNGSCGKCRVRFVKSAPEPTEKEKKLLSETEIADNIRLACATVLTTDCTIELVDSAQQVQTVEAGGQLQQPTKASNQSRITGQRRKAKDAAFGIAIDIGTTTLAMSLLLLDEDPDSATETEFMTGTEFAANTEFATRTDSTTGTELAVVTSINHQRTYGADVLSRIQAANEGKGAILLECIRQDLNRMLDELLKKTNTPDTAIKKIAIAGNTTMCHLLLGYSCEKLGVSPFIPEDISLQEKSFSEVFDNSRLTADVTILPGISAFIGADIVAGIYACDMHKSNQPQMLLDIGTNGEMVIGNKEGFIVTSAAAGPVFEGGGLTCGVAGVPGAVSHLRIEAEIAKENNKEQTYSCTYETIGSMPPIGLCGSGVIDAAAELLKNELIDENGTLEERWFEDGFPIADDIYFSQRDIREIQMGKSAIRSGIETLLEEFEKQTGRKAEQIFLAGGFGCFMDVKNAVKIGLFPEFFLEKRIIAAGNTALKGAEKFLTDTDAKKQLQEIVSSSKEQNLALHDAFQERYLEYMFFGKYYQK